MERSKTILAVTPFYPLPCPGSLVVIASSLLICNSLSEVVLTWFSSEYVQQWDNNVSPITKPPSLTNNQLSLTFRWNCPTGFFIPLSPLPLSFPSYLLTALPSPKKVTKKTFKFPLRNTMLLWVSKRKNHQIKKKKRTVWMPKDKHPRIYGGPIWILKFDKE